MTVKLETTLGNIGLFGSSFLRSLTSTFLALHSLSHPRESELQLDLTQVKLPMGDLTDTLQLLGDTAYYEGLKSVSSASICVRKALRSLRLRPLASAMQTTSIMI